MKNVNIFFSKLISLLLIISSCNNNHKKRSEQLYKNDTTKYNLIVSSILKDSDYHISDSTFSYAMNADNNIILQIRLCCNNYTKMNSLLFFKIHIKETRFFDKEKFTIDLLEWTLRDSIIAGKMEDLIRCGDLYRCSNNNIYRYFRVGNLIYFSRTFGYHDELKDILKNVKEIYFSQ